VAGVAKEGAAEAPAPGAAVGAEGAV